MHVNLSRKQYNSLVVFVDSQTLSQNAEIIISMVNRDDTIVQIIDKENNINITKNISE